GSDRLEQDGRSLHESFLKRLACSSLERHLRRVYRMVGSIVEDRFHSDYRVSGERSFHHGFLESLFHCREIVLRNSTANYALLKNIRRVQIMGRLKFHLDMSVLSVAARLFLIFHIHIRVLADRFAESNFRSFQNDLYFVPCRQLARRDLKMLVSHAVEQCL